MKKMSKSGGSAVYLRNLLGGNTFKEIIIDLIYGGAEPVGSFYEEIFNKDWYYFRPNGEKVSNLSPDQIYQVFDWIVKLRKRGIYYCSDPLRDRLKMVGFRHIGWQLFNPKVINGRLTFPEVKNFMKKPDYETLEMRFGEKNIIEGTIREGYDAILNTEIYLEI